MRTQILRGGDGSGDRLRRGLIWAVWLLVSVSAVSFAGPAPVQSLTQGIPIYFEPNVGQFDPQVRFMARGAKYQAWITDQEMVLMFSRRLDSPDRRSLLHDPELLMDPPKLDHDVVRIRFGLLKPRAATGLEKLTSYSNYFIGNDPKKWRSDVPNFAKAMLEEVYPGIDIVFYGEDREIEYDFIVKPGANPGLISLDFSGPKKARVDSLGNVSLGTTFGTLVHRAPLAFQGEQVLQATAKFDGRRLGFNVGPYDRSRALTIDPVLEYSTLLGGSNYDLGRSLAVDSLGNAYVTGFTYSADFPTTPTAFDTSFNGGYSNVFVAKLNASGSTLIYSTFLGPGSDAFGIAVDSLGNAYVTGYGSAGFPTTEGAFATSSSGAGGIFVTKLNASGSALIYSSLWGSGGNDSAVGIAVDTLGNAYVTGWTASAGFPTTPGAFATTFNGGCQSQCGFNDGFVAKLNASGSALIYSTFLGGTGNDEASGIAVDTLGNAYVTGLTSSADFPITPGAFDTSFNSGEFGDPFVAKLNPTGSALIYSTFLGTATYPGHIAIDALGNAYVAGTTASAGFPTTPGAFDASFNGGYTDIFATELNAAGDGLIYSTFLGGNGWDYEEGIAVNALGEAYVVGATYSADFPTTPDAFNTSFSGTSQPFMSKLDSAGSLAYSTLLGIGNNSILGIAVEALGNAYVTGGYSDVLIAKISFPSPADTTPPQIIPQVSPTPNATGWNTSDITVTWAVSDPNSGIASKSGCTTVTLIVNTPGTTITCSATNGAGLSSSVSVTVKLDKSSPVILPVLTPPATPTPPWYKGNVLVSWTVNDPESGISSPPCAPAAVTGDTPKAGTTFTCTATNGAGLSNSASVTVFVDTTPPGITDGVVPRSNDAGWNNTDVTVVFTCTDTLSGPQVPSYSVPIVTEGANQPVSFTCSDFALNSASLALVVNVDKTPPVVASLTAAPNPAPVGTSISLTANLTDGGPSGLARAEYSTDGGMTFALLGSATGASAAVTGSLGPFATQQVLNVCVRATDVAGNQSLLNCTLIAIYDPSGGFATGQGTFLSLPGALVGSAASGKAQFAFESKYLNGATVPTGSTKFKFNAGDLDFSSTSYDWLVIAGARAQFKGEGVIKGQSGSFDFILTAIDGALLGGDGQDKFRIKIMGSSGIVYDNQMSSPDSADPTTVIDGSIVIHK